MLDKIIKISSIFSGLLIFLGVIKQSLFYNYFNINIIDYLTLSEIVTSFLDDLNIIIVFYALIVVYSFTNTKIFTTYLNTKIGNSKPNSFNFEYLSKLWKVNYPHKIAIFFAHLIMFIIINSLLYFKYINYSNTLIIILLFLVIQGLLHLVVQKNSEDKISFNLYKSIGVVMISTLIVVFYLSQYDIQKVNNSVNQYEFQLLNRTIICDSKSTFYVGKTENFTFLFNKELGFTEVIPNTQIVNTKIKLDKY